MVRKYTFDNFCTYFAFSGVSGLLARPQDRKRSLQNHGIHCAMMIPKAYDLILLPVRLQKLVGECFLSFVPGKFVGNLAGYYKGPFAKLLKGLLFGVLFLNVLWAFHFSPFLPRGALPADNQ